MEDQIDSGASTVIVGEGDAATTTTTATTITPEDKGEGGQGGEGGTGSNAGEGAQGKAADNAVSDSLFYDGQALPDFVPPDETPREKELRLQLEELKQQGNEQRQKSLPVTEPEKPKRDNFYSDEEYETALRQHFKDQDSWQQRQQQHAQSIEAQQMQFREAVGVYVEKRQDVATKLKDFDRIEKYADENLKPEIVAAIVFGNKSGTFTNAPEMMYAIGRNPQLMKQLNETDNPFLAGAMLLDISKKSSWAPSAPKKDLNAIPEVSGAGGHQSMTAELEAAEAEAERTGDRTRVIELRAKMRNAKK